MNRPAPAVLLPNGDLQWGALTLPPEHPLRAKPIPSNYRVRLALPSPWGDANLPPFDVRAASEPEAVTRARALADANSFAAEAAVLVQVTPINR